MEMKGKYLSKMEDMFCEINLGKGYLKKDNMIEDYFYQEYFKSNQSKHL